VASGFITDVNRRGARALLRQYGLREQNVSVGIELYFNQFVGLMRGRFPSPLVDGVLSRLRQDWMPASYRDGLCRAVGRYQGLQLHSSSQIHGAGKNRIRRDHPIHDLALAFRLFLLPLLGKRNGGNKDDCPREKE